VQIRFLGWAGVEVQAQGEHVVVDPLQDARAVFAWLGDRAAAIPVPDIVPPADGAVAGLVTHLHRDHADAGALAAALASDACVFEPEDYGGADVERLAIAQADHELTAAGLSRRPTAAWSTVAAGPFTITALPAVDGTGDPQVSWLIEADGSRILHLGDTMFHGWWWRIAERFGRPDVVLAPINGPRVAFPHRLPASALSIAMEPEQAALAADLLQADRLVPMHYGAYEADGVYEPCPDPVERICSAASRVTILDPGDGLEV
jgi:L-ascorbate metabolism protein UlaG (beta-lactamase superfamily)